jgi:hypothetical protein
VALTTLEQGQERTRHIWIDAELLDLGDHLVDAPWWKRRLANLSLY